MLNIWFNHLSSQICSILLHKSHVDLHQHQSAPFFAAGPRLQHLSSGFCPVWIYQVPMPLYPKPRVTLSQWFHEKMQMRCMGETNWMKQNCLMLLNFSLGQWTLNRVPYWKAQSAKHLTDKEYGYTLPKRFRITTWTAISWLWSCFLSFVRAIGMVSWSLVNTHYGYNCTTYTIHEFHSDYHTQTYGTNLDLKNGTTLNS